jgi:hypothetical protein
MLIETSIIKANCRYLEDKWLITINPIILTYKNEFDSDKAKSEGKSQFLQIKNNSGNYNYIYTTWVDDSKKSYKLPPIDIKGIKLSDSNKNIEFPGENNSENGKDNALWGLYDLTKWNAGEWSPVT